MGQCYSCVVSQAVTTREVAAVELDTGDIVLLQDKAAPPIYISRAQSWVSFTHVGFLVRDGAGPAGLAVFHADRRTAAGSQVVKENLQDVIDSGRYRLVLARRLHRRLGAEQRELVSHFAELNLGKASPASAPHATILMAGAAYTTTSCERLHCSEFVATMLHLAGLVRPSPSNPLEFTPTHPKGHVVEPPVALTLPHLPPRASPTSSLDAGAGAAGRPRSPPGSAASSRRASRSGGEGDSHAGAAAGAQRQQQQRQHQRCKVGLSQQQELLEQQLQERQVPPVPVAA